MYKEVILSIILLGLLVLFLNPFNIFMPSELVMLLTFILVVSFTFFAVFVFREKAADEREVLHRYVANRYAYLLGSGVLVLAIVVQEMQHRLDPWIVIALAVMIFAKVLGLVYSRMKY